MKRMHRTTTAILAPAAPQKCQSVSKKNSHAQGSRYPLIFFFFLIFALQNPLVGAAPAVTSESIIYLVLHVDQKNTGGEGEYIGHFKVSKACTGQELRTQLSNTVLEHKIMANMPKIEPTIDFKILKIGTAKLEDAQTLGEKEEQLNSNGFKIICGRS